ncbi:MAG: cupin domain-containing protein [FCB group bacterium]|jgi:quercetin dioxygenase-like cupin family protein
MAPKIEYEPHSVVNKTIIKKPTGKVSIIAVDDGEVLEEKIIPFDTVDVIIEGAVEIIIDGEPHELDAGEAIIIPAHTSNKIIAKKRFKMIQTIIKSGYE